MSHEPVDLARLALKRLSLVGKGVERDRRPTPDAIGKLTQQFDSNPRLAIPMTRIVQFAAVTVRRLDEICRVEWRDLDLSRRLLLFSVPRRTSLLE